MKKWETTSKIMGTNLTIQIFSKTDPKKNICIIHDIFADFEWQFSRFLPASTLSQLNSSKKLKVSDEFIDIFSIAKTFYENTNGIFNPLASPISAGYTKTFDTLKNTKHKLTKQINTDFTKIKVKNNEITLSENQFLDFGGFLKGHVADLTGEIIQKYPGSYISVGGDIIAHGTNPDNSPLRFGVTNPLKKDQFLAIVDLKNEALATSGTYKRKWSGNGEKFHHIIDPATKTSSKNKIISATVKAEKCVTADALATACIIADLETSKKLLKKYNAEAIFLTENGEIICTGNMKKFLI